ncbi:hypothetical protein BDV19DRAFT_373700 [Aspergillus venezuelensis]
MRTALLCEHQCPYPQWRAFLLAAVSLTMINHPVFWATLAILVPQWSHHLIGRSYHSFQSTTQVGRGVCRNELQLKLCWRSWTLFLVCLNWGKGEKFFQGQRRSNLA